MEVNCISLWVDLIALVAKLQLKLESANMMYGGDDHGDDIRRLKFKPLKPLKG